MYIYWSNFNSFFISVIRFGTYNHAFDSNKYIIILFQINHLIATNKYFLACISIGKPNLNDCKQFVFSVYVTIKEKINRKL